MYNNGDSILFLKQKYYRSNTLLGNLEIRGKRFK